jgi:hypothetical protein
MKLCCGTPHNAPSIAGDQPHEQQCRYPEKQHNGQTDEAASDHVASRDMALESADVICDHCMRTCEFVTGVLEPDVHESADDAARGQGDTRGYHSLGLHDSHVTTLQ